MRPSHSNRLDHLEQFIVGGSAVESHQDIADVGVQGGTWLRVHQPMVDVLVQLHYLEQVVLEVLELITIAFNDPFLGTGDPLEFLDAVFVLFNPAVELYLVALWFDLLVDLCAYLLAALLVVYLLDHLPEVLVLVIDVLQGSLRLVSGEAAPRVLPHDDPPVWPLRIHN